MLKTVSRWLVVGVVCLVWVGSVSAEEAAKKGKDKEQVAKKMRERAEQQFKKLDANGDGKLAPDEFARSRRKAQAAEAAKEIFELMDKDDDGFLSLEEFVKRPPEVMFKMLDRNNDGKVTLEEFKAARKDKKAAEKAEETFKTRDKNGDGVLTLDEFKVQKKPAKKAGVKGRKKRADNQ